MFCIAKRIFWISIFLIIISNVYPQSSLENNVEGNQTEIQDLIFATKGTVSYAKNICNEKPEVCVLWKKIIRDFKKHSLNGAKIAYNFAKSILGNNKEEKLEDNSKR
ncbi:DUF5330 domain-containing protein [Candidatus Liberibacter brunswickensis]|uniref:DUF5330 domain-containing protein n=1 Tax=Candidatus Liberibacter brunswickensis TaxID=1968796 RepID=UPI002FE1D5BA